ncbi:hypothetical protein M8J75_009219 [Diaphorina citri]|nr:hypothetical protein M8J75_009219 [Diaphorina citri]
MPPRKAERRPSPDASGGVRYRNHNLTPPNTQGAARKMTSLGALVTTPTSVPFLERVKDVMRTRLPEGWEDWRIVETLPSSDNLDRNKLRFGLPTVDLIRAYDPSGRPISERSFKIKYMKSLLFGWPVGQALLTNPGDFAESLRPSKDEYNIFLKGLASLKRFCISREAANEELRKEVLLSEEGSVPETGVIRTPSYESLSPSRPAVLQVVKQQLQPVNDRLSRFEERFDAFQTNITALLAAAPRSSGRDHGEDAGSESFSFRSDFCSHNLSTSSQG